MSGFVCAQFSSGPRCRDNRIEKTDAEKKDCIKKAYLECVSDVWSCRLDIIENFPLRISFTKSAAGPSRSGSTLRPLDDLKCYSEIDDCIEKIRQCYCAGGMTGLTCTPCPDDLGGFGPPTDPDVAPSPEDDTPEDEEPRPPSRYVPITVSSTDGVIPLAFGRVILGGNIVWVSAPRTVSAAEARVDFALALCEGPVDRILRVWFGDTLVVDNTAAGATISGQASTMGFSVELVHGSDTQGVIPDMVGAYGRTPAHRGLCYAIFRNYTVLGTNSSIPQIRVEITTEADVVDWVDTGFSTGDALNVHPYSRRMYLTNSGGDVRVARADTGEIVEDRSLGITGGTLSVESNGDLSYQLSDNTLVVERAFNRESLLTYVAATPVDFTRSCTVPSLESGSVTFLMEDTAGTVTVYRAPAGSSLAEYSTLNYMGDLKWAGALRVASSQTSVEDHTFVIITSAGGVVRVYTLLLRGANGEESSTEWSVVDVALTDLGGTSVESPRVVAMVPDSSVALLFMDNRAIGIDIHQPRVPLWISPLSAPPSGIVKSAGTLVAFIADGYLWTVDTNTGSVVRRIDVDVQTSPDVSGEQFYDSETDNLVYAGTTGTVIRVSPGRAQPGVVSLSTVIAALLSRADILPSTQDVGALTSIPIDGYVVHDFTILSDILRDIATFYHLGVYESADTIRVVPLGVADTLSMSADNFTVAAISRSASVNDTVGFVRVGYYDSATEFSPSYQEIVRSSVTNTSSEEIGEGVYYPSGVFTSAERAKLSAEMHMLRTLNRIKSYDGIAMPRGLILDPLDIVSLPDGTTFRVKKTLLDPDETLRVSGLTDSLDVYNETPEFSVAGFEGVVSQLDGTARVANIPVVINLPTPQERGYRPRIWVGQVNPETDILGFDFSPDVLTVSGVSVDAATQEALVGVLVSATSVWRTMDTTLDTVNTIVVKFSKIIPSGTLTSATREELYESFTRNLLVVGQELLQFMDVTIDVDNRTATFTNLLRGRFGTETKVSDHIVGEDCAYYTPDSFGFYDIRGIDSTVGRAAVSLTDSQRGATTMGTYHGYTDSLTEWLNLTVVAQAVPLNTVNSYVAFGLFPRVPSSSFFTDSSQIDSIDQGETFRAFLLSGPFDQSSFTSAYLAGESSWGTSSYILAAGTDDAVESVIPMSHFTSNGKINTNNPATSKFVVDTYLAIVKGGRYTEPMRVLVPAETRYHMKHPTIPSDYIYPFGRTQRG